jgi:hypothetical protein
MKESSSNRRLLPADMENRPISPVHYAIEVGHPDEGHHFNEYGMTPEEATEYVEQFMADPELRRLGYTATARKFTLADAAAETITPARPSPRVLLYDVFAVRHDGKEVQIESAAKESVARELLRSFNGHAAGTGAWAVMRPVAEVIPLERVVG